jgi:CheY-like chemotaxis protein
MAHRILVIEDNPDAAEALGLILSTAGHEVVVAHSGEEGVALARTFRPRVVLSDIGLPGMSGYDVARAIRREEALASTYLVAITGYGQEADQKLAHAAGFAQHLTKPVDTTALERLLASLPLDREV